MKAVSEEYLEERVRHRFAAHPIDEVLMAYLRKQNCLSKMEWMHTRLSGKQFIAWLATQRIDDVGAINREVVDRYIRVLSVTKHASRTMCLKLLHLRGFLAYIHEQGLVKDHPFDVSYKELQTLLVEEPLDTPPAVLRASVDSKSVEAFFLYMLERADGNLEALVDFTLGDFVRGKRGPTIFGQLVSEREFQWVYEHVKALTGVKLFNPKASPATWKKKLFANPKGGPRDVRYFKNLLRRSYFFHLYVTDAPSRAIVEIFFPYRQRRASRRMEMSDVVDLASPTQFENTRDAHLAKYMRS
jgi:hypothetical protein